MTNRLGRLVDSFARDSGSRRGRHDDAGAETRPELRGGRLLLRPVHAEDRERLERILQEPEVARRRRRGDGVDEPGAVSYAIEADGEPVGLVRYREEGSPGRRHARLDVVLATAAQGRGLAGEALRTLARHLFDERGHHRLTIEPPAADERAIRACARVGFRPVGVMRQYERGPDGAWRDVLLMDLLPCDLRDATRYEAVLTPDWRLSVVRVLEDDLDADGALLGEP